MGYFFYPQKTVTTSGGGSMIGAELAYASPSGAQNDVAPPGFVASAGASGTGRLLVTLTAAANWTGLEAGSDGQLLQIFNYAGGFPLTLNALNGGSGAANQFNLPADLILVPNNGLLLVYTAGSVNQWLQA